MSININHIKEQIYKHEYFCKISYDFNKRKRHNEIIELLQIELDYLCKTLNDNNKQL